MKGSLIQARALELKNMGMNPNQISVELGINYRTAKRMIEEPNNENRKEPRKRKSPLTDIYKPLVREQLMRQDKFSGKQVYDNIKKERSQQGLEMTASLSLIQKLVNRVRIEEKIPKPKAKEKSKTRSYRAVPDTFPGQQAQFDFGEQTVSTKTGGFIKLHWGILILSYSRYRYVEFQLEPIKTSDAIRMLDNGFKYFNGIPREIVIDQDSVMVSKEKRGEIELTSEFDNYVKKMPFHLHILHKADPESKGKVERSMSYIEGNLLNGYTYISFEHLEADVEYWMNNIANAEINQTTKEIPADRMIQERENLLPIPRSVLNSKEIITHQINKDNTVWYKNNRYEVPEGTYLEGLKLKASIYVYEDHIELYETQTGVFLASHQLESGTRGKLYTLDGREKNNEGKVRTMIEQALETLKFYENADLLVKKVSESSPDFIVEQLTDLIKVVQDWRIQEKLLTYVFNEGLKNKYLTVGVINEMIMTEIKKFDLDPSKFANREDKNQRWETISEIANFETATFKYASENSRGY